MFDKRIDWQKGDWKIVVLSGCKYCLEQACTARVWKKSWSQSEMHFQLLEVQQKEREAWDRYGTGAGSGERIKGLTLQLLTELAAVCVCKFLAVQLTKTFLEPLQMFSWPWLSDNGIARNFGGWVGRQNKLACKNGVFPRLWGQFAQFAHRGDANTIWHHCCKAFPA